MALVAATGAASRGFQGGRPLTALVSVAAALVILGVSILPLLTPAWIHGEQDRAGSAADLGSLGAGAHAYSDAIVHDLLLGGGFYVSTGTCVRLAACPLLNAREVEHMVQVRAVFQALGVIVLSGMVLLVLTFRRSASAAARATWWRAVSRGGVSLAGFMLVVGLLAIVAFDAMFQVFHELLFPPGTFTFDPATEHLVQVYPDQFWSDTTLALGVLTIAVSLGVAWIARYRALGHERGVVASATPAGGVAHRSPT